MILFSVLLVLLSAGLWRLGGGAFTNLTGIDFGADPARGLRACVGFLLSGWVGFLSVIALFFGICFAGWGPFQGMGLPAPYAPEKSWLRWLPENLGFPAGAFWHDFVGMIEAGVLCMAPVAAVVACWSWPAAIIILAAGPMFAPCYALARITPWVVPKFAAGQEWGEVFTGALIGASFIGASTCFH
jgi:hypothetical protein